MLTLGQVEAIRRSLNLNKSAFSTELGYSSATYNTINTPHSNLSKKVSEEMTARIVQTFPEQASDYLDSDEFRRYQEVEIIKRTSSKRSPVRITNAKEVAERSFREKRERIVGKLFASKPLEEFNITLTDDLLKTILSV